LVAKNGTCLWPVQQKQRATVRALGMVQRNLGRRIIEEELSYLRHSEVWHEFLYRVIRGETIALPWQYVDDGPVGGQDLEDWIASGLAPYHVKRPQEEENVTPPPTGPPEPSSDRERRIRAAKMAKRRGPSFRGV
jgi:hypothetical protein